jgi:hypothetical protein
VIHLSNLADMPPPILRDALMRATWTAADFRRASTGRLRFVTPAP